MEAVEYEAQIATADEASPAVDEPPEQVEESPENESPNDVSAETATTAGFDRLDAAHDPNRVSPAKIVEAALFVGGTQLTGKNLRKLLGGNYPADFVEQTVDDLNRQYAEEKRPYEIQFGEGGYRLALKSEYHRVRNRVFGVGPKEIRLSQDALETLSLVAYRQPVTPGEIDKLRGQPSAGTLRQLIRRELIALQRDPENRKHVEYRTTARFLEVFGLRSMHESIARVTGRIDMINTRWSLIRMAHGQQTGTVEARKSLVLRYSSAIRKYLGAVTRNTEEADDLAQDVVVRMLNGDFAGADPDRGRFRDFLKTCIRNMARNYWSKKKRRKTADLDIDLLPLEDETVDNDPWIDAWQSNLLNLTWAELENYQNTHAGSVAHTVLRLRADFPDESSEELAERLSEKIGKPVRADAARQQLKRARKRFAEMLIAQIADVVDNPTAERVEDELQAVGLYDQAAADEVALQLGGLAVCCDVGVENDIQTLVARTEERFGPIDLFCSNAGITVKGGLETSDDDWRRMWDVNFFSRMYAARAVVPGMLKRGSGYLLHVASAAGLLTEIGSASYTVTKHADVAFAEWLSVHYGREGIGVSVVCPLGVETAMIDHDDPIHRYLQIKAIGPGDVADAVVEGLSDERFLILPHPEVAEFFQLKTDDHDRWLRGFQRLRQKLVAKRKAKAA
eukprot:g8287.t1